MDVADTDFSALHCPSRTSSSPPSSKTSLRGWNVECSPDLPGTPSCFDAAEGVYTVPADGLYAVMVELIPIGTGFAEHSQRRREHVDYALRLQEPSSGGESLSHPNDEIESEYIDVGSVTLGQMVHLKAGTAISCIRMPHSEGAECVRLKVDMLQRKKKRPRTPELTKKELKKRKKMKRKQESCAYAAGDSESTMPARPSRTVGDMSAALDNSATDDDDSDSYWSEGFESDRTDDELPHSRRGVGRLAKRFKATAGGDCAA